LEREGQGGAAERKIKFQYLYIKFVKIIHKENYTA